MENLFTKIDTTHGVCYNGDFKDVLPTLQDESIDIVLTDPPYLYLTGQKLDKAFDEELLFNEIKRLLKPDGFVVLFGRGTSFYRWNTILSDLGFNFKEEIIWNKLYTSSPFLPLGRVHETVSIHSKGKGQINRVKIPYLESRGDNIDKIIKDVNMLSSTLENSKSLKEIQTYLTKNKKNYIYKKACKNNVTVPSELNQCSRAVSAIQGMEQGMNEKSIIEVGRENYKYIHPTQKPIRLLERLLMLVAPPTHTHTHTHTRRTRIKKKLLFWICSQALSVPTKPLLT